MDDKLLVQAAYEATFAAIYRAFYEAYTSAGGDKQKEADAEAHFQFGVTHVRHVRDRALELLPGSAPKAAAKAKATTTAPARKRS